MAIILNIETATTNCSVSLAKDGELLLLKEDNSPNYSHSEQLHVFIQEALQEASLTFSDISAVAVSKGPGSYTGLRIGVSAAKGLCFSLDLPLIAIPTLEILGRQAASGEYDFIVPLLDARRMEVYAAVYGPQGQEVRETRAEIITGDSYSEFIRNGKVLLIGDGAEKCKEVLHHPHLTFVSALPSAREMADLSFAKFQLGQWENLAYFEPFYLKDFILQGKKSQVG